MLQITVPSREVYDENNNLFFTTKECVLRLEHSLLSISKWESKYHKPFLKRHKEEGHTAQELEDYIKCMTLNTVPEYVYSILTKKNLLDINAYIDDPMTATTIARSRPSNEIITSELIYYWMTAFNIPFECEKWHLNRLLMLIKVCNAMANPPKNQAPDMAARRRLNEARLAAAKAKNKR